MGSFFGKTAPPFRGTRQRGQGSCYKGGVMVTKKPTRGRPVTRGDDRPIRVPMPFEELVADVLKAGPHPGSSAEKPRKRPKAPR